MGFNNEHRGGRVPKNGVGISLIRGTDLTIQVFIVLRNDLKTRTGWKAGIRLKPEIGYGPDKGTLRLTPSEKGYKSHNRGSRHQELQLQFPAWKGLPEFSKPIQDCQYKVNGSSLIVTLPEWS